MLKINLLLAATVSLLAALSHMSEVHAAPSASYDMNYIESQASNEKGAFGQEGLKVSRQYKGDGTEFTVPAEWSTKEEVVGSKTKETVWLTKEGTLRCRALGWDSFDEITKFVVSAI